MLSMLEARVERRKPLERRKEIKVTEQPPKEEKKVEKKPVQETFEFFNEVGPYKLPPVSLLDETEKKVKSTKKVFRPMRVSWRKA